MYALFLSKTFIYHLLNLKKILERRPLLARHPGVYLVDVIDFHQVTLLVLLVCLLDQPVPWVQLHVEREETLKKLQVRIGLCIQCRFKWNIPRRSSVYCVKDSL